MVLNPGVYILVDSWAKSGVRTRIPCCNIYFGRNILTTFHCLLSSGDSTPKESPHRGNLLELLGLNFSCKVKVNNMWIFT